MKSRLEQLLDELLRQIDIPAMEQAMSKQYKSQIRRRWELPADYWMLLERCCGLRTVWSNDTYEALELWGLDTLVKGQEGYAYNPVEQKVIKDWDEHLVVIASDAGDPYCLDLRRNDTAVFWAEHGAGTWDFQPAFDCLEDFLESVLDVPKTQEYETAYPLSLHPPDCNRDFRHQKGSGVSKTAFWRQQLSADKRQAERTAALDLFRS